MTRYRTSLLACMVCFAVAAVAACSGRHSQNNEEGTGSSAQGATERAANQRGGTLTVKGSDTMVILAQRWAEAFMRKNQGSVVQVGGGGSGTGIAALINGTTDLANSSRAMKDSEKQQLKTATGRDAQQHAVALDALSVYVNEGNPLQSLDLDQIKRIFRGQITNWKDVGGPNAPIVLYSRENNSGTYVYFKEEVLDDEDFAPQAQTLPGTAAVINAVSRDRNGIGYGGVAYAHGARPLKIAEPGQEPIEATMENAVSGRYPLSRQLFIYSAGTPTGTSAAYLEFVLSPEGQQLVEGVGYYPLPRQGAPAAPAQGTGTPSAPPATKAAVPTEG